MKNQNESKPSHLMKIDMMHIDDWLDQPNYPSRIQLSYAKFILNYFRYPAWAKRAYYPWMREFKLFCTYESKRYRVIGASGMGDIWLTSNAEQEHGYELRVAVNDCDEWSNDIDVFHCTLEDITVDYK